MVSNTKEQALEAAIEQALTGQCLETLGKGGWRGCRRLCQTPPWFRVGAGLRF